MPETYAGTKICGVEATLAVGEEILRFTNREIRYTIQGELPGLSNTALNTEFTRVTSHISSKCGAKFIASGPYNIVLTFGQIDGSGKTLAWSQLRTTESPWQVQQKHDNAELWTIASNPPSNRISWGLVALHETIHSLGCPHLSGGVAVMNPIYNPQLQTLQPLDIAWLVSAYGEPQPSGEMPTPIGDTLLGNLYIDANGFLKVRKL